MRWVSSDHAVVIERRVGGEVCARLYMRGRCMAMYWIVHGLSTRTRTSAREYIPLIGAGQGCEPGGSLPPEVGQCSQSVTHHVTVAGTHPGHSSFCHRDRTGAGRGAAGIWWRAAGGARGGGRGRVRGEGGGGGESLNPHTAPSYPSPPSARQQEPSSLCVTLGFGTRSRVCPLSAPATNHPKCLSGGMLRSAS